MINSIVSDFNNAALDEELIIKYLFPDNVIYYENIGEKRKEPPTQNIMMYLKANKIYEFDDAHNEKDEQLKNDIMFNVFGFEDRVLGDIIWATHDTFYDSNNFFKDYLFGGLGKSLFGKGEWPIIYWYRYRHPNPDINDCVTYTISR